MIWLYSGTPGSGKSYHAAKDVYSRLRAGKRVISNTTYNMDMIPKKLRRNFSYVDNSELTVDYLEEYYEKYHHPGREGQTLIIIDECSVKFNSRDYQAKDRMRWITFFQQHRKLGYNVILISQSDRLIDRQIRQFIEYDVKHRLIRNFNISGLIVSLFVGGTLFAAVTYWYGVREKTDCTFMIYRRRIAKFYNTYQIFKTAEQTAGRGPGGERRGDPSEGLRRPSLEIGVKV